MYKSLVILCFMCCVVIEARPKWQFLSPKPGYIPVYIRPGDTPLEEINPDLAEAFHAFPAGRSAGKELEASPENPDVNEEKDIQVKPIEPVPEEMQGDQPQPQPDSVEKNQKSNEAVDLPEDSAIDHRPYDKKKNKKATEVVKPVERR